MIALLEELHIRGVGVIEDAVLPFGAGLTAVTGETGAGKTMVVTSLLLLFGGRADAARVRSGTTQASVDGVVSVALDSASADRVRAAGGEIDDDGSLALRRVVSAAGRSRAYVGGTSAPVGVLSELSEHLLAVHGQSDQLRLTKPPQQRAALDRFAGVDLATFSTAYRRWRNCETALTDRTSRLSELRREAELLHYGIAEIDAVAPAEGEDVELTTLAGRLGHVDALRSAARLAHNLVLGDSQTPMDDAADVNGLLSLAMRSLGQQAGDDHELDALAERVADLAAAAVDVGADLGAYAESLEADPARLAQVQQRRSELIALVRKYGQLPQSDLRSVAAWRAGSVTRLQQIDVSDEAMAALAAERDNAAQMAALLAEEISQVRAVAAAKLAHRVTAELAGLAMPTARIVVAVRRKEPSTGAPTLEINGEQVGAGVDGIDDIEFLLQSHPSAPALPVARSASGGELSRVMLALELCLVGTDPVPTMIFDEVDAGVGGRAAIEVGRRLARLSKDRQVIVVTHLAQVAAFADCQLVVNRPVTAAQLVTTSDVHVVKGEQRIAEMARMLAGSNTETAREHAAELLADAESERASS